jgi:hypothetical protein
MATIKYDDASWHYGGDYPKDLDESYASVNIGMFVAWCLLNNLGNRSFLQDIDNGINQLLQHQITPGKYVIEYLDEVFTSDIISVKGCKFVAYYY